TISTRDWSSDVCSSDLPTFLPDFFQLVPRSFHETRPTRPDAFNGAQFPACKFSNSCRHSGRILALCYQLIVLQRTQMKKRLILRSEEHTSELQSRVDLV